MTFMGQTPEYTGASKLWTGNNLLEYDSLIIFEEYDYVQKEN